MYHWGERERVWLEGEKVRIFLRKKLYDFSGESKIWERNQILVWANGKEALKSWRKCKERESLCKDLIGSTLSLFSVCLSFCKAVKELIEIFLSPGPGPRLLHTCSTSGSFIVCWRKDLYVVQDTRHVVSFVCVYCGYDYDTNMGWPRGIVLTDNPSHSYGFGDYVISRLIWFW